MNGSFVIRTGDGAIAEHPIRTRCTIGSSAPSDLVLDGAAILPLHATVEVVDGKCWIAAAGGATIAINGQPVDRRALRHLDVVTLGAGIHLIFSTSTAVPRRDSRTTQVLKHTDLTAPPIATPPGSKTVHGVPAAAFKPQGTSPTATFRVPIGAQQPFSPDDTQVLGAAGRTITSIRLHGADAVYEAKRGVSMIGRAGNATIRIEQPEVSRAHAALTVTAATATIEDLSSTRGTTVNGSRITGPHSLTQGDVVTIGKVDLRVEIIYAGGAP